MICLVLTIFANLFPSGEYPGGAGRGRAGPGALGGASLKPVLPQPTAA